MRGPTIKTIAKEAGVSVATVSKALNNMPDISDSTKAHICEIAQKQGYTINSNARELVKGHSHSVGVILPDLAHPGHAQFVKGLHDRLKAAGFSLYLNSSGGNPKNEILYTLEMMQNRVGALVFLPGNPASMQHVEDAVQKKVPLIYAGVAPLTQQACTVAFDDAEGGRLAAQYLWQKGHRQCRVFTPAGAETAHSERVRGFVESFRRNGGQADTRQAPAGLAEEAGGMYLAKQMLERQRPHTAIFAVSDEMALGTLAALAAAQSPARTPVAVVGFGDIPVASMALINLTTLALPYREMGIHAGDMAAEWLRGLSPSLQHVLLPPTLVQRGTA